MREPKRLAHRQAERNRARAQARWFGDDLEAEQEPSVWSGNSREQSADRRAIRALAEADGTE